MIRRSRLNKVFLDGACYGSVVAWTALNVLGLWMLFTMLCTCAGECEAALRTLP